MQTQPNPASPAAGHTRALQLVDHGGTGPVVHQAALLAALSEQPRTDWVAGLVEFLTFVAPECPAMPEQHTHVLLVIVTVFIGFVIGGGLKSGK